LAPAKVTKTSRTIAKPTVSGREVRIFVSYSHVDSAVRDKLEVHLAALKRDGVVTWYDGDMQAGDALDTEIARALRQSHLFVALLSPDYLASHYCWKLEYQRAMGRRARGTLRVVAVVVRPCDWKATTATGFKLLPTDGKPVSRWRSQDQALLGVTQGIRKVVQAIRKEASAQEALAPRARAAKIVGRVGAPARAKRGSAPARKLTVRTRTKTKR
jgi:TIR domain